MKRFCKNWNLKLWERSKEIQTMRDFFEFFAGGGMARAGLGAQWNCRFANDIDRKKGIAYALNWGRDELAIKDVRDVAIEELPGVADLVWSSFPCQDLSLAGGGAGLSGERSGTFWPFWEIIEGLNRECRKPSIVVLENVCGAITSHDGTDFTTICSLFAPLGYSVGALVIDAAHFVPQSRPRLFIIGVSNSLTIPETLKHNGPKAPWHSKALISAFEQLDKNHQSNWIWWNLPENSTRVRKLAEVIDDSPDGVEWSSKAETERLLGLMSEVNRDKIHSAMELNRRIVGTIYKRTRKDRSGVKRQRAEVRFDGMAGCLRTPAGGSSRQTIIEVRGDSVRTRLLSGRETARLMGLPDTYKLPATLNDTLHLTGDGVVVPVVRHLAAHVFEPILDVSVNRSRQVA